MRIYVCMYIYYIYKCVCVYTILIIVNFFHNLKVRWRWTKWNIFESHHWGVQLLPGLTTDNFCNCNYMSGFVEEHCPPQGRLGALRPMKGVLFKDSGPLLSHALTHSCISSPSASKWRSSYFGTSAEVSLWRRKGRI